MGTRGYIGIQDEQGALKYVYCGHDSYPSHLGDVLLNTYNTKERVEELIALGDMSSVEDALDECEVYDEDPMECAAKVVMSLGELVNVSRSIDYTYIFKDSKWIVSQWDYCEFKDLTRQMVDEDC